MGLEKITILNTDAGSNIKAFSNLKMHNIICIKTIHIQKGA